MPRVTPVQRSRRSRKQTGSDPNPDSLVVRPSLLPHVPDLWLYSVILCIAIVAAYLPVHHHPFSINDDEQYVVNNPHLQHGLDWPTLRWAFTTYDLANWHPLTWLSHAADVQMFQLNPSGHHDVNLAFHVLNAILLFWVLERATGYAGRSFMVAALFALHPVNVETVAWIAERKNLLSAFFFLLGLGAYRWYAIKPRIGRYALVTVLFALGLMAKPQIVTFPFVLLLWDYWPLQRSSGAFGNVAPESIPQGEIPPQSWSWLLLEKVPWLALSFGSAVVTMRAQSLAGALRYYPLSTRLENAVVSYARYVAKAFWPSPLIPFYPRSSFAFWQVATSLSVLAAVTGFVLLQHRQRYLAVGWFWFLGTLVPMLGIVQVGGQAMADRYAYLSFIGLFLMICWGISDWAKRRHLASGWLVAPSIVILLIVFGLTYRQLNYWSSNVKLWTYDLEVTSGSFEGEHNLGEALLESGEPEQAMQHFERVIAFDGRTGAEIGRERMGDAAIAHLYLGVFAQQHGQPEAALDHYRAALALIDSYTAGNVYTHVPPVLRTIKATTLANMGYVELGLGRLPDAKANFQEALQVNPREVRSG